jgi:hypothetical protein
MGSFRNNNKKYPIQKNGFFFLKLKLWVYSKTAITQTMGGVRIIRLETMGGVRKRM